MIRRPLTSIEVKLDDLEEFMAAKRLQQQQQQQQQQLGAGGTGTSNTGNPGNTSTSTTDKIGWNMAPKSTKEIHDRIGLTQQTTH